MRLLIDEHLSPRLVDRLARKGVFAQHIAHIGLAGRPDPVVWRHALCSDATVVTTNAKDFLALVAGADLHPGIILIRESGLTREEQWRRLEPVVDHLLATGCDLTNRVVEDWDVGRFDIRDLPC